METVTKNPISSQYAHFMTRESNREPLDRNLLISGVFRGSNPSLPDPGRGEKTNLNFYFHTYLWCLKRSVKIKI